MNVKIYIILTILSAIIVLASCQPYGKYSKNGIDLTIEIDNNENNIIKKYDRKVLLFKLILKNNLPENVFIDYFRSADPIIYKKNLLYYMQFKSELIPWDETLDSLYNNLDCTLKQNDSTNYEIIEETLSGFDTTSLPRSYTIEKIKTYLYFYYSDRVYIRAGETLVYCIPVYASFYPEGKCKLLFQYSSNVGKEEIDELKDSLKIDISSEYEGYKKWEGEFRSNALEIEFNKWSGILSENSPFQ